MIRRSSRIRAGLLHGSLVLSLVIFSPSASSNALADPPRTSAFCGSISPTISSLRTNVAGRQAKLAAARTARDQKLADNRSKWDAAIISSRATWDQKRQQGYTVLEGKATTDSRKTAVTAYEHTIDSAVTTRRRANDAARATYRAAVDNAVATQRTTVDAQTNTLVQAGQTAGDQAQASCEGDPATGATARLTMLTALKDARTTYAAERKNDSKLSGTITELTQIRDTAIKANDAAFARTTQAARDTLRTAFGDVSL